MSLRFQLLEALEQRGAAVGHGVVSGAAVRIGEYDLDFNFTSRYQPVLGLPG